MTDNFYFLFIYAVHINIYVCLCACDKIQPKNRKKFQSGIKHQLVKKKVSENIYYKYLIITLLFTDAELPHQNPQSFVIS